MAAPGTTPSPQTARRPGWPEILAAAAIYGATYATLPFAAIALADGDEAVRGVALAATSGVMGLLAFGGAALIRIRRLAPFGVRRIGIRWVLIAIGMGVVAVVLGRLASIVVYLIAPDAAGADPQGDYRAAATGGVLALVLQLVCIAVLTPLGEELAFRAVLTNALRRYGALVSVVGSTIVFALAHGINLALIPAVIVGAISAILFLRSGSVWPGVIVHAVNNAAGTLISLAVGG
jgi:uncharacterized protein